MTDNRDNNPELTFSNDTVTNPSSGSDDSGIPRPPFQSVHRRNLNYIRDDAAQHKMHKVPEDALQKRNSDVYKSYASKAMQSYRGNMGKRNHHDWLSAVLPCYKWLRTYSWRDGLPKDLIAGLTVGVMVVPQSMSYARLAGLPVEYGLYSSLLPIYAYSLFGSSRQLAVGPVALVSLILSTELVHLLEKRGIHEGDPEYVEIYTTLAIQTAFLVGVAYIIMGLLRLGFVTVFLSHAVVSGFTTGAAVIIGMSQVKYIFGYDVERSDRLHVVLANIIDGLDQFNYKTFLMGMSSVVTLATLKHIGKTYPRFKWVRALGPLSVTAVTIAVTWIFSLQDHGIPIVGTIPKGIPSFTAGRWVPIDNLGEIMPTVISITVVGFMESIAIAKQLASKHKYELDSSTELIGLGMSNFAGAMFQSYPVTGSFSRSAVNNDSGAMSGISGMVTATMVLFVLLFLTPVFEKMPLSVLAAIVISGVLGLLDYPEAIYLWKVHKFDFFNWTLACTLTMFLGVEIGLAIAVVVSLLLVTYESAYPHTAVLGRLPGTTVYRNVKQYDDAETYDGIVMVRIDAPIYFANTQNVREKLAKYERRAEEELTARGEDPNIKYLILEMSPVSHVDTSALHILHDMNKTYKDRGIQLCFSNPSTRVMDVFLRSGLVDEVGREHIFVTIHDAISWCLQQQDEIAISTQNGDSEERDLENPSPLLLSDSESSAQFEDAVEDVSQSNAREPPTIN
mmetsp:Transcript_39572/g.58781  ORF Transcript_39572/g.58781 Transcript_39572/m.58781 type:complete len:732 (-) Transcript_39572:383-2578(-)|eukprot:CAMPEP_0194027748 /NCGR_PEP_ID=MMETSP0009_2-20130614/1829_1 /TAXON_ID=210454 /ORGANISM="Grammatophora oceanica, Strain CCMP 410" /LENGTH=731 /DNA_ID=CAMNT_0038666913 /DNA_START=150 /DNA_END=2345 /DNA_ORIENTATION=-